MLQNISCNLLQFPCFTVVSDHLSLLRERERKGKGMLRFNELELSVVCVESRGRGQAGMRRAEG